MTDAIKPEHPVGPAFNEARDQIAFLESRLTEAQRAQYDEFVKKQEREREEQKQKAALAKAAHDQAKEKHPRAALNYNPPMRIKDPHTKRLAVIAQNEQQNLTTLERTHIEDKVRMLEKLDQQREKQEQFRETAQQTTRSRATPEFARAASPERQPQQQTRDSALSRAFEKAKAQEQARERTQTHTQSQEQGRNRGRGRT